MQLTILQMELSVSDQDFKFCKTFYLNFVHFVTHACFDVLLSGEDIPKKQFDELFEEVPEALTEKERAKWLKQLKKVSLSSDGFFPFRDCIDRAYQVKIYRFTAVTIS